MTWLSFGTTVYTDDRLQRQGVDRAFFERSEQNSLPEIDKIAFGEARLLVGRIIIVSLAKLASSELKVGMKIGRSGFSVAGKSQVCHKH